MMGILNKYMNQPKKTHMEKAHHILIYLMGIEDYEILYQYKDKNDMHGFTNVDWANDMNK
jgi:hypothetical protein